MPYCTRCGKKIAEGEKCSCQKKGLDFDAALKSGNPIKQFFGLQESSHDSKVKYERNMQIIPENVTPNEGEIPIRQYDLCTLRSRIKFMRAEGRLQVTNKRIIFRAKGTSLMGPTVVQHEFVIAELSGFQISRNFRFSILDLLLIFLLDAVFLGLGWLLFGPRISFDASTFGSIMTYILGLAVVAFTFFLNKHYATKACLSSFALATLFFASGRMAEDLTGMIFLLIPALIALIQKIASDLLFSFKPNLDFNACNKMQNVMHIRCERALGFGQMTPMSLSTYTGYNEVLPTEQTDEAIRDIGAMVADIQMLGDLAIEKWKVG